MLYFSVCINLTSELVKGLKKNLLSFSFSVGVPEGVSYERGYEFWEEREKKT